MVTAITEGIRISVKTKFRGCYLKQNIPQYVFSYEVFIENRSDEAVQLLRRHWLIADSLNHQEQVEGSGVIGQTPIIEPRGYHQYESGCHLYSGIGAMKGSYLMRRIVSGEEFKVTIPTFQLFAPYHLN